MLEVVRNGKNSMFLLILLNLRPKKSPFSPYYPKSVLNPDISIISLLKNDKILVLAKISFLTISVEILIYGNALVGQIFDLGYFSNLMAVTCLSLYNL